MFLSHSSTAVPNKIVSLQWAEEDKFGFSSSFHLFDAFITKGRERESEQQVLFVKCPHADVAFWVVFFFNRVAFSLCLLNLSLPLQGEPCADG